MRQGWQELTIGGVPQWVSLRGATGAPVLLFLHGGPGASEYGARRRYLRGLEQSWRVVDWEQRGAGRSFRGEDEPLDLDLLIGDGTALVERLCADLGVDEVTLVGHSFGTVLGVEIALRVPRRIGAYVLRREPSLLLLLSMPVLVTLTGVLFWGNPRFRRPAEIVLVVLAGVAIDALLARRAQPEAVAG